MEKFADERGQSSGNVDSLERAQREHAFIANKVGLGDTLVKMEGEGIYYQLLKQGTGRQVSVTDTVTVHYKGTIYPEGSIFDQTKEKPARFPLNRLIKGWQSGLVLCREGGSIRLVVPSGLAYGIRNRAAKIPPNSILQFEIEVVATAPVR
jgi:FKBP-type peptidyl-prolyl cis-trans isomerase FkpA